MFLSLLVFLVWQNIELRRQNSMMLNQVTRPEGRGAQQSDPYISGPVKNRILKGSGELKKCFQAHTAANPEVRQGNMVIDWQVDTDGDVISPEIVTSPFKSEVFHRCMVERIASWKFPPPTVRKYVSHTFKFTDAKSKKGKKITGI